MTRSTSRHRIVIGAVIGAVMVFGAGFSAKTATATSCAVIPDLENLPSKLVADASMPWGDGTFFTQFDFALTGTVTEVVTKATSVGTPIEPTMVSFDVINGFGIDDIESPFIVREPDAGDFNGYLFVVGQTYFVPITAVGPHGESNYSALCDPIVPMTLAEAETLALSASPELRVALPRPLATNEVASSATSQDGAPIGTPSPQLTKGESRWFRSALAAALACAAIALTVIVLTARRRRRTAPHRSHEAKTT